MAKAKKRSGPKMTGAAPAEAARSASVKPSAARREREMLRDANVPMCRSCGKRPGRPTAILGQMMQAELCPECTALRKERIRLNRAAARSFRGGRIF
jgi:hypothetical protein